MSLEFAQNRLENSEKRVNKFIDNNLVDWAEEEVLRPAQKKAFEVGLSQNAANGMKIEKDGFMKVKLIWEYRGQNDEPLHLFLEKGFGKGGYNIESRGKLFGGADSLSWIDKTGKRIFRHKVRHPGFEGYHIMENAWKENKPHLKRRVIEEVNNFLEANRL